MIMNTMSITTSTPTTPNIHEHAEHAAPAEGEAPQNGNGAGTAKPVAIKPATTITRKKPWNPSAAPTRWKKCRSACRASAASTKFKK